MSNIDRLIADALQEQDDALSAELLKEPGYFEQAFGLFTGQRSWEHILMMIVQTVMFVAGVWCAWHFFAATELVAMLRWGFTALTLLIMGGMVKMALMPVLEANRILREIRRLELRVERLRADTASQD